MRKSSASALALALALPGVLSIASPALADTTWTVTGGGTVASSLKSGTSAVLRNVTTGQNITCRVGRSDGSIADGTGLPGAGIGTITSSSFGTAANKCSGSLFSTFTTTQKPGSVWSLNAVSYANGVMTGTITGIETVVTGSSLLGPCNMEVSGQVNSVTYDNTTGELTISPDADPQLTVGNVSGGGCGFIKNGDKSTMSATFVTSPKAQIISP